MKCCFVQKFGIRSDVLVFQRLTTVVVVMDHVIVTIASRSKSIENQNQMAHSLLNGKTLKNIGFWENFLEEKKCSK